MIYEGKCWFWSKYRVVTPYFDHLMKWNCVMKVWKKSELMLMRGKEKLLGFSVRLWLFIWTVILLDPLLFLLDRSSCVFLGWRVGGGVWIHLLLLLHIYTLPIIWLHWLLSRPCLTLFMNWQLVTSIVILDLSAAFDTVDHDLLLDVLETRFGITGTARRCYESYMKPRKFRVLLGKEESQPRQLDYSVPQGSIQGAFLFVAYASTLDEIVDNTKLELNGFADDHSVRRSLKPGGLDHKEELETIAIMEKSAGYQILDGPSSPKDEWELNGVHLLWMA